MKLIRKWQWAMLGLLLIGGVWWWQRPQEEQWREYTVAAEPLQATVAVSGTVAAQRQADLSFTASGKVVWVGIRQGDWVRRGQGLASLDQRTVESNLRKELNDYLKTRWDFQGTRETYNITSDDLDRYTLTPAARRIVDKTQFDLNNAVLDVEIQAVAKEVTLLLSPWVGIVADLPVVDAGVNVTANTRIATIVDPDSVYFAAQVDELDIAKVAVGQAVELVLDAYPEETIKTWVEEIGFVPVALSGGGTGYEVKMVLPQPTDSLKYRLGMNGDAVITVKALEQALTLPIEAVIRKDGKSLVNRREGKTVKEAEVITGIETAERIEIKQGLVAGDRVVVREAKRR